MEEFKFNPVKAFGSSLSERTCILLAIKRSFLGKPFRAKVHYKQSQFIGLNSPFIWVKRFYTIPEIEDWGIISIDCANVRNGLKIKAIEILLESRETIMLSRRVTKYSNPYNQEKTIQTTLIKKQKDECLPRRVDKYLSNSTLDAFLRHNFEDKEMRVEEMDMKVSKNIEQPKMPPVTKLIVKPPEAPMTLFWFDKKHWELVNDVYFPPDADIISVDLWTVNFYREGLRLLALNNVLAKTCVVQKKLEKKLPRIPYPLYTHMSKDDWDDFFDWIKSVILKYLGMMTLSTLIVYPVDYGKNYAVSIVPPTSIQPFDIEGLLGYRALTSLDLNTTMNTIYLKIDPEKGVITHDNEDQIIIDIIGLFDKKLRSFDDPDQDIVRKALEELILTLPFTVYIDENFTFYIEHTILPPGYVFESKCLGLDQDMASVINEIKNSYRNYHGLFDRQLLIDNE